LKMVKPQPMPLCWRGVRGRVNLPWLEKGNYVRKRRGEAI